MSVPVTFCHRVTLSRPGDTTTPGCPEQLLLSALGQCMLASFEAFAVRDGIEVVAWSAQVEGRVERSLDGLMFSSIVLSLELELAGQVTRAEATLEEAKQSCLVLNSLRVPVVFETRVRVPGHDVAAA